MVPLCDLEAELGELLDVWSAQSSFEAAVNSKISGFQFEKASGEGFKDRGDVLVELVDEHKEDEKISVMDSASVAKAAKDAHSALVSWRNSTKAWKPPLNTTEKKAELDVLFEAWDKAQANLESYISAVKDHDQKKEIKTKDSEKVKKKRITGCLNRFYVVLRNTGLPKLLAKVHFTIYFYSFSLFVDACEFK